jgi:hypothetical protein
MMASVSNLWSNAESRVWEEALQRYPAVVADQGVRRLPELDGWYRDVLPGLIAARRPAFVALEELVLATEWKMARGVWRQRNLLLVRSNPPELVEETSRTALAAIPDPQLPVRRLATLAGVGPATASALLAAHAPEFYPFFDELVAAQVPGLGSVDFTLRYYVRYADALRERATALAGAWTPSMVERALWAHAGGKARV